MSEAPGPASRSTLDERLERGIGGVLAVLIAAMAIFTGVDVALRSSTAVAPAALGETMPDLFVWATFLGAALASRRGLHLGIPVLRERAAPRLRVALERAVLAATVVFLGALALGAVRVLGLSLRFGERMPMGHPAWIVEAALPVGALAIAWGTIAAHRARATSRPGSPGQ